MIEMKRIYTIQEVNMEPNQSQMVDSHNDASGHNEGPSVVSVYVSS